MQFVSCVALGQTVDNYLQPIQYNVQQIITTDRNPRSKSGSSINEPHILQVDPAKIMPAVIQQCYAAIHYFIIIIILLASSFPHRLGFDIFVQRRNEIITTENVILIVKRERHIICQKHQHEKHFNNNIKVII